MRTDLPSRKAQYQLKNINLSRNKPIAGKHLPVLLICAHATKKRVNFLLTERVTKYALYRQYRQETRFD
jgi:hypothetical protein